jgi:hypothetical protein
MTSNELLDLFRKDVVDTAKPYLWSDSEIYAYMNDAYFMYVRLMGGIADSTSVAVTQVIAQAGEPFADLHPSILTIRGAYRTSDNKRVEVINYEDIEKIAVQDFGVSMPVKLDLTQGSIVSMVIGMEDDVVRFFKVPSADDVIQLSVYRLPLEPITGGDQTFEGVKDHHHIHFLKWMKAMAYSKQDTDTFNKVKASEEEMKFRAYCEQARLEWERKRHKPRVVQYGGI